MSTKTPSRPYDPSTRIAGSPDELREVIAGSKFGSISNTLDYSHYFPRAISRAARQRLAASFGSSLIYVIAGSSAGAFIYAAQIESAPFFVGGLVAALVALALVRRLMWPWLHAQTSEHSKFIELLAFDERPPVVYLRRFDFENPMLPTQVLKSDGSVAYSSGPRMEPLENIVDTLLNVLGPVVGLGRPGDTSIEHRIFRFYINHADWQNAVAFLLSHAGAVFLQYDRSASLDWELEQTIDCGAELIFVLITDVADDAQTDHKTALSCLPPALQRRGRTLEFRPRVTTKYVGGAPALLVALERDGGRIYGIDLHFKALWDIIFGEVARTSAAQKPSGATVTIPKAYEKFVRAESSRDDHPLRSLFFAACLAGAAGAGVLFALHHFLQ